MVRVIYRPEKCVKKCYCRPEKCCTCCNIVPKSVWFVLFVVPKSVLKIVMIVPKSVFIADFQEQRALLVWNDIHVCFCGIVCLLVKYLWHLF